MHDVTITSQQRQTAESSAWAKTLSDLLDGNKQSLMQWLQGAQAFSDELSSFAQARMLLTIDAWSTLLACRSPEQVVEHQRRFIAKAMNRCAEELTSLSQLTLQPPSSEPSK
jgi:hypothetical protein